MAFPIPVSAIENRHYINGSFCDASDKGSFDLHSPYNHEKITSFAEATVEDVDRAVAAAKAAFPAWAALTVEARGTYMKKLAQLIRDASTELSQLEAMVMGRPVSSYFDAHYAATHFDHYAEAGYEARGYASTTTPPWVNVVLKQPIGPVAAIIPWNAPLIIGSMKIAPALAAGCTVVLKSSEKAPLTPAKLATLVQAAGFPPGVVNIIGGHGNPSGTALASHMDIRLVTFTGSVATGRLVQIAAAKSNMKKVILELGGKSPAIVFEDANIARAAADLAVSFTIISGQICVANSRIYVQETVVDRFVEAMTNILKAMKKGDPLSPETTQGPQADRIQYDRVKDHLTSAPPGSVALGGQAVPVDGKGFFIDATILKDVPEDARVVKEEIFGPVTVVNSFKTELEAIAKANDTEYGLDVAVFTKDIDRAMRVAQALESGTVGVNCTAPGRPADAPFGGYKSSGQGREGYGYSLDEYLETKAVLISVGKA